ncbi:MAG TPA: Asp-tRNA(Asn)/Glu-tRNA(Gln) amidotransferase subunit GatA [Holophagaceae bacterium]|nr:Asp-tRNA(Asn)/Glu-tRNA(Gln) amidotransferase subunit GatA [Holophagaceae bacterium]
MAWATPNSLREGLAAGDLSAEGLVHAGFDRINRLEGHLHAVLSADKGRSLDQARAADARLARGERGPVLGLPVVLKDNLHWKGAACTSGSKILDGYRAPYDATVVARLLQAGAVPLAKANMDEFAMGSSGEFSAFGPARNPWDATRVPGGSSSGSAVSVAAGYAPFALGSDTGGSVRLPSSFCNLTALRPTYGVLSRYGVTSMASSLDQVGPIARTAEDVAALLSVMAGADPLDATSVDLPRQEALWPLRAASLKGLKVGLPREYFGEGLEAGVREAIEGALATFKDAGAELVEVDLPHTRYAIDAYYLVCTSEVSSNLSRFDGLRYGLSERAEGQSLAELMALTRNTGFGAEAKRRILLGTFCLSKGHYDAFYLKALKVRTLILRDFLKAFEQVDVLATPVSPTVAFPLGAKLDDPLAMHLADVYAVGAPLAGLPALAFPAGFSAGLPVGMQLMGPSLSDVRLLEFVQAFQDRTDYHLRTPEL